ncbi:unnamed protein product [Clonostachys byssicola]|uniref:Uncharacterized protein n=1 Tax=Clonostachys byssicola TaxID=160290 RepID=A0A9N9UX71_9HYPO|nr:unnamed protein product [Clonostachys byssicola]
MCTYEQRNPGKNIKDANYRMVSVHTEKKPEKGETLKEEHVGVWAPCDGEGDPKDQGGCNTVTQKANINVIPDHTPAAPYNHDDYTVAE